MNAIFCIYNQYIIGIDGKLPSQVIPELGKEKAVKADMAMFKHITKDAIVVMGRKTWESLDCKPLPGRKMNIIITSTPEELSKKYPLWKFKDPVNFLTKEQFNRLYADNPNVWIIGGHKLLEEYIPRCEQVYINEIMANTKVFPLEDISTDRILIFDYSDLIQLLKENNFIPEGSGRWPLMAKQCLYSRENATLFCYHFYKCYLNGWDNERKFV